MATYETFLLMLVVPVLWWLMALLRAFMDLRARAAETSEWDGSEELCEPSPGA